MKQLQIFTILMLMFATLGNAQPPQGFSYQAAIRDAQNQALANTAVTVRVTILEGSVTGTPLYSEDHQGITNPQGVISLAVGFGDVKSGTFRGIQWAKGTLFIQIDVDIDNSGTFIPMGASQILSVPYALHSGDGLDSEPGTAGQTLAHTGERWAANSIIMAGQTGVTINAAEGHDPNQAIFAVRNSVGDTVFAVYESGVKIFIDDNPTKAEKGGFAIGGLSNRSKELGTEYFRVTPDSSFVQFNSDPTKAEKGGFAIGGLSNGKTIDKPYFSLEPAAISFNYDMDAALKAEKGGFAIGGLSNGKEIPTNYFTLNADSIRMYIDTDPTKAEKGGFAIGGLSNGKLLGDTYFSLKPELIQFSFDETLSTRAEKGGFAVGGLSNSRSTIKNYFQLKSDSVVFAINEINAKGTKGSFAVGSIDATDEFTNIFNVDRDCTYIANTIYSSGDMYVDGNINTGGTVGTFAVDIDGNSYPTIKIGTQTWMAQNLRTTRYRDGSNIEIAEPWSVLFLAYENTEGIAQDPAQYGYLYLQEAVYSGKQICPTGWRLPTAEDWNALAAFTATQYPDDMTSLLSNLFTWESLSGTPVTNASGFNAIPAGNMIWNTAMSTFDEGAVSFFELGMSGAYWILDAEQVPTAHTFPWGEPIVGAQPPMSNGYSVRCIK